MSKRVKSLGPSVGDDPDEVYLATLVQECKARGIGATKGEFFTYKAPVPDPFNPGGDIECCCAEGARMLVCQTEERAGTSCTLPPRPGLAKGNDQPNTLAMDSDPGYLANFTIGMCFQDAMSDEGTEP